jgi:exopolyphosphatase
VSALGYAWLASTLKNSSTVPLVQSPRNDLQLRAENLHALQLAGLSSAGEELLCLSDLALPSDRPFPSRRFALVDHNRLLSRFTIDNPSAEVVAVVDHHDDEGLYKDTADPRVIVVPNGSCASLVAQLIEREHAGIPRELAVLLLSAILVDTSGLKPYGKAQGADNAAASFLLAHAEMGDAVSEAGAGNLHEVQALQDMNAELQMKKAAVNHLGTRDLLRRDYKEYSYNPFWEPHPSSSNDSVNPTSILVGLASVPLGLKEWMTAEHSRDDAFWRNTRTWMEERSLDVLGILTSFRDENVLNKKGKPKHFREQMWIVKMVPSDNRAESLAGRLWLGLEGHLDLELKRVGLDHFGGDESYEDLGEGWEVRAYKQKNTDATRKVTAPAVRTIIEGKDLDNSGNL